MITPEYFSPLKNVLIDLCFQIIGLIQQFLLISRTAPTIKSKEELLDISLIHFFTPNRLFRKVKFPLMRLPSTFSSKLGINSI